MPGIYQFALIRRWKVHKFDQDKASRLAFSVQGGILRRPGVCAPACFLWLEDRFTRPTVIFGDRPDIFSNQTGHTTDDTHTRFIQRATLLGQQYYSNPHQQGNDYTSIERQLRISKIEENQEIPSFPLGSIINEMATLFQRIKLGEGFVAGVIISGDGHMIAGYRSQGNNNYFFDPNTGVYKFRSGEEENFFQSWASCYSSNFDRFGNQRSFAEYSSYRRM